MSIDRPNLGTKQLLSSAVKADGLPGYVVYTLAQPNGVRLLVFRNKLIYTHLYGTKADALEDLRSGEWKKRRARGMVRKGTGR